VTTTIRYSYRPESTENFIGFRCAADAR